MMFHKVKTAAVGFIAFTLCFLAGCGQQTPAPENHDSLGYPTLLADMDGWHGVQVMRSESEGLPICNILFPEDFGIVSEEKEFLEYLVSQAPEVGGDTDCFVFPNNAYKALDQFLHLALTKQDMASARILLNQGSERMPFQLDGEMAESYTESYLIPLLEGFEKFDLILDQSSRSNIAQNICSTMQWHEDIRDDELSKRISSLIEYLSLKGEGQLARQLESCK